MYTLNCEITFSCIVLHNALYNALNNFMQACIGGRERFRCKIYHPINKLPIISQNASNVWSRRKRCLFLSRKRGTRESVYYYGKCKISRVDKISVYERYLQRTRFYATARSICHFLGETRWALYLTRMI